MNDITFLQQLFDLDILIIFKCFVYIDLGTWVDIDTQKEAQPLRGLIFWDQIHLSADIFNRDIKVVCMLIVKHTSLHFWVDDELSSFKLVIENGDRE